MTGAPLFQSMPPGRAPQCVWQHVSTGTAGHPGGVWNDVLWLLMQCLVVQAYCAEAGAAADKAMTLSARKYRNMFIAQFPTDILVLPFRPRASRSLPAPYADVHYYA